MRGTTSSTGACSACVVAAVHEYNHARTPSHTHAHSPSAVVGVDYDMLLLVHWQLQSMVEHADDSVSILTARPRELRQAKDHVHTLLGVEN
jgi:hypothetical protein